MSKTVQKVVVLGAPTFVELVQLIHEINEESDVFYEVIALLDDNPDIQGTEICGVKVKGALAKAATFGDEVQFALNINNSKRRIQRYELFKSLGIPKERFVTLIHPSCSIAKTVTIGYGCFIWPFSFINYNACIGDFSVININSIVGANCQLGASVLFGSRVTVLNESKMGNCSFIGSCSTIGEEVEVGPGSFIGIGSVVLKDVKPGHFTMGNTATAQIHDIKVPGDILDEWDTIRTKKNTATVPIRDIKVSGYKTSEAQKEKVTNQ